MSIPPIRETVRVCTNVDTDLPPGKRMVIQVEGRNILVVNVRGRGIFAVDNACYHHGMPLQTGDIEDIGNGASGQNQLCLICPYHKFMLSLETGEGFYWAIEASGGFGTVPQKILKSKGPRQRTHRVYTEGTELFVEVDTTHGEWASDEYGSKVSCNKPEHVTRGAQSGAETTSVSAQGLHSSVGGGGGGGGMMTSGQVFRQSSTRQQQQQQQQPRVAALPALSSSGISAARTAPGAIPPPTGSHSSSFSVDLKCTSRDLASMSRATGSMSCNIKFSALVPQAANALLLRPGMWVRLRIFFHADPMQHGHVDRQYTVVSVGQGALFGICVRHLEPAPSGGGGAAHHLCTASVHQLRVKLLESGGDFHFHAVVPPMLRTQSGVSHQQQQVNHQRPAVIWLTAGIGITPLLGFMNALLAVSGSAALPPLHVCALHAEKKLASLPQVPQLDKWVVNKQLQLGLFLTQEDSADHDMADNVHEILGGRTGLSELRLGSRYVGHGVVASLLNSIPGKLIAVMICGPEGFMKAAASEVKDRGVPDNMVLTEKFDH